jgi:hypothetical protein
VHAASVADLTRRFQGLCQLAWLGRPWPWFTIFDPVPRWRELSSLPWPGDIGPIVMEGCAEDPPSTVALTYSALGLAKRYGTTPEAIKAGLKKLDGVYY